MSKRKRRFGWLPRVTFRHEDGSESESVVAGLLMAPVLVPLGIALNKLGKEVENLAHEIEADIPLHRADTCRQGCRICEQKAMGKTVTVTLPDGTKEVW